jgi:bacteriorhodopsin
MKLSFALLALTVAQDDSQGAQSQSQGAQSQGADSGYEGADSGYEAPAQESYAAPTTAYSAPSYEAASAPAYVVAPKCCVHSCPAHAPFFSLSQCGCVGGVQYAQASYSQASYEQPQASYAAQSYEGGEQQTSSGYRFLVEVGNAPAGTIDTRNNTVGSSGRVVLWVGFIILFLAGWWFINKALRFHFLGTEGDINLSQMAFLSGPAMTEGFVCLIAALAYLTMATGNGAYSRCSDGRTFFYARYIDWVITTPIMLHGLCEFAGAADDVFIYLFFSDILMIVAGLIASVVENGHKWFFFAFSILCFIPVIHYICWLRSRVVDTRFDYSLFFWNYSCMANLTAFAWFCYPIVWIMAEGVGTLNVDGEVIIYAVLDIIAKALLGFFIITSRGVTTFKDGIFEPSELAAALVAAGIAIES